MTMTVRCARLADVPAMHAIRLAVHENRLSDPRRINQADYVSHLANRGAWVAEIDGRVSGFAILDVPARTVWALFVDPNAEGLGIGTALHARMVDWATHQGFEKLWLDTSAGTRAEHFYEAAGWTRTALTGGDIRFECKLAAGSR